MSPLSLKKEPHLPTELIQELIHAAENRFGTTLPTQDFDYLTYSVSTFVSQLINKFVLGAKEHQDSFLEVNHQQEITSEILDLWNYHTAQNYLSQLRARQRAQPQ